MADAPAIAFEDVSRTFGGARPALDHVSLAVRPREFLAVVGPSGSGKTTLLRLINRLSDPDSGRVLVDGEDVRAADPIVLRRRIGYVFQGIGLFPHLTAAENIAITPKLLGWDAAARNARADELLDLVRLDPAAYRGRFAHEMSGGERQRIGVARALAACPRIVLMDEPFSALDTLTRDALGQDYRALHAQLELTTVMITHDMLEALLLADRIVVMHEGRIAAEGAPADLMRDDQPEFVRDLLQAPRRHAERLGAFLAGSGTPR
jgi:osmoprotectant transport system ATP-binding protein